MSQISTSVYFTAIPGREQTLKTALYSFFALEDFPVEVGIIINNYNEQSHASIDLAKSFGCSIFALRFHRPLSSLWNMALNNATTESVLICNDDVLFNDRTVLSRIQDAHSKGAQFVRAAENFSGFSITKAVYKDVGIFDETFKWSWEDFDYRIRMAKEKVLIHNLLDEPIKHCRELGSRREDLWVNSALAFFQKWDVKGLFPDLIKDDKDIEQIKKLLFSGFFHGGMQVNGSSLYFFDHCHSVKLKSPHKDLYS